MDPGFPGRGGGQTYEIRAKTYYLARFLLKTACKWKKLDREGARTPRARLDPPMAHNILSHTVTSVCVPFVDIHPNIAPTEAEHLLQCALPRSQSKWSNDKYIPTELIV